MNKIKPLTDDEIAIQIALGILPEEYRNNLCRNKTPKVSKGLRICHLCNLKCIHKGEEFYQIDFNVGGYPRNKIYINICKTCSWLSAQTINKIIAEYNASQIDNEKNKE